MVKKFFAALLAVVLLLAFSMGGALAYAYHATDENSLPGLTIAAGGRTLDPVFYDWHVPVSGGILYRDFAFGEGEPTRLDTVRSAHLELGLPSGYQTKITVRRNSEPLFAGSPEGYRMLAFPSDGEYELGVSLARPAAEGEAYGRYEFAITFPVVLETAAQVSADRVAQGDVLAIEVTNAPEGVTPTAETALGLTTFTPAGKGRWTAFTPVSDKRGLGDYPLTVTCGDYVRKFTVKVVGTKFARQELWINTGDPVISKANSAEAYQEYRDTMYPLFETADPERYWSGKFIQPVQGRLTTQYGLLRYTNGQTDPSRHAGIDLATPTGTPVKAPAAGRVVLAKYLLNTGNTLVIEHGGGLKTYYFHMSRLDVKPDDRVAPGQIVGAVGTTGYSTGPHLHFEVRIGSENINPWNLINGTGGFFALSE